MQSGIHRKSVYGVAALIALCVPAQMRAAERLMLANGFDVICNHHALVDGRVRVYPKAQVDDYFELKPEAIRDVEWAPDPAPDSIAAPATANAANATATGNQTTAMRANVPLTAEDLRQLLTKAGSEHNVDVDLLASVVKAESGGNARAVSRAGARGLMQLMPSTAQQLGVANSFVPEENVRGGTAYLDSLLSRYHDNIVLALAAYNAGPEAVDRYRGIPPYHETRLYVARVVHEFNRRVAARERLARVAAMQANLH